MPGKNKKSFGKVIGKTLTGIIFTINILSIILLIFSISAWYIPPYKAAAPAYIGLAFPFILVLNALFLLFWLIFFKWKFALCNLIVLISCWSPISTYFPIHRKTPLIPEDCIKVLSYNVRGFNWFTGKKARENPIFEYLNNSGADIICLQEFAMDNYGRYNPKGIISIREVDDLLSEYPYRSIVKFEHTLAKYTFGVACYSKYPILKTTEIPVQSTTNGSVLYEIKIKNKTISLINNHLESNRITSEDKKLYREFLETKDREQLDKVTDNIRSRLGIAYRVRASQADIISHWIQNRETDATIVCGDFNDTPISYTYKTVKGDSLIDSFAETGLGQGITYNENMFLFRIDFIMHTRNIESYNCTVDEVKYSDHYPIYTYLRFKD